MYILSNNNTAIPLVSLVDSDDEVSFSYLDNTEPNFPDFYFQNLVFIESYIATAVELKLGNYKIIMPVDWSIVVGDGQSDCDLEILPVTTLTTRGFEALTFNPISSFRTDFLPIEVTNMYPNVKWCFPKLTPGHALTVPIKAGYAPPCCYFMRDIPKQSEIIILDKLQ